VEKDLVIKENRRGGRYCFAKEKRSRGRAATAAKKNSATGTASATKDQIWWRYGLKPNPEL